MQRTSRQTSSPNFSNERSAQSNDGISIREEYCFLKKKGIYHKIHIEDILYIKSEGDYTFIHTAEEKFINTSRLGELELLFAAHEFYRTHRSYIINLKNVTAINTEENSIIVGSESIPISRAKKGAFLNRFRLIN